MGVQEKELNEDVKTRNKGHFKKMYEQKEYMEEYLKFKEVIAGMKKWENSKRIFIDLW